MTYIEEVGCDILEVDEDQYIEIEDEVEEAHEEHMCVWFLLKEEEELTNRE